MKKKGEKLEDFPKGIFWSRDIKKLRQQRDAPYIIHQVLMYGGLEDIKKLIRIYSLEKIRQTFIKHPTPIYTKQAFNFITKFILDINPRRLEKEKYVKSIY